MKETNVPPQRTEAAGVPVVHRRQLIGIEPWKSDCYMGVTGIFECETSQGIMYEKRQIRQDSFYMSNEIQLAFKIHMLTYDVLRRELFAKEVRDEK